MVDPENEYCFPGFQFCSLSDINMTLHSDSSYLWHNTLRTLKKMYYKI